eukprot:31408-Pelagococcus_subviridis.AAC.15
MGGESMIRTDTRPRLTNASAKVTRALALGDDGSATLTGATANIQWSSKDSGKCATSFAASVICSAAFMK